MRKLSRFFSAPSKTGGFSFSKKAEFDRKIIFSGFVFYLLIVFLVAISFNQSRSVPKVNEVAPLDINCPVNIEVVDQSATEKMRQEAEKSVPPIYRYSDDDFMVILKSGQEVFATIATLKKQTSSVTLKDVRTALDAHLSGDKRNAVSLDELSKGILDVLPSTDFDLKNAQKIMERLFVRFLSDRREKLPGLSDPGVRSEFISEVLNQLFRELRQNEITIPLKELIGSICYHFVRPTSVIDEEAMKEKRLVIRNRIQPIKRRILKGEILIRHGEIIKPEHLETFRRLKLFETSERPWGNFLGTIIVSLITVVLILLYLYRFKRESFNSGRILNLLALIILLMLIVAKIGGLLLLADMRITVLGSLIPLFSPFLIPIIAATLLVALMIDTHLALFANMILALLVNMDPNLRSMSLFFAILLSGSLAVLVIRSINHRSDLTRAGTVISVGNVLVIAGVYFMEGNYLDPDFYPFLYRDLVWGFINGFLCTIVTVGFLPYLESFFKISTSIRLLELSDLNQPLLRQLGVEAPGTYHHSIIVGTLAEAAAKDIGADPLLCRVGAYYHDIGKLKRPTFFVENQSGVDNIHDTIKPNLSALVIMSHCREGIEIGDKFNLPQEILDIIEQHHGTNLLTYFYMKAQEASGEGEDVGRQEVFRYPGPKPQSREAAIVFLADSVEAATRSLSRPTPASLKGMIKKIATERFTDGQFDDSDLTLKDLEKLNHSFARTILGMFHSRIEYPGDDKSSKNRRDAKPKKETITQGKNNE